MLRAHSSRLRDFCTFLRRCDPSLPQVRGGGSARAYIQTNAAPKFSLKVVKMPCVVTQFPPSIQHTSTPEPRLSTSGPRFTVRSTRLRGAWMASKVSRTHPHNHTCACTQHTACTYLRAHAHAYITHARAHVHILEYLGLPSNGKLDLHESASEIKTQRNIVHPF